MCSWSKNWLGIRIHPHMNIMQCIYAIQVWMNKKHWTEPSVNGKLTHYSRIKYLFHYECKCGYEIYLYKLGCTTANFFGGHYGQSLIATSNEIWSMEKFQLDTRMLQLATDRNNFAKHLIFSLPGQFFRYRFSSWGLLMRDFNCKDFPWCPPKFLYLIHSNKYSYAHTLIFWVIRIYVFVFLIFALAFDIFVDSNHHLINSNVHSGSFSIRNLLPHCEHIRTQLNPTGLVLKHFPFHSTLYRNHFFKFNWKLLRCLQ